LIIISLFFHKSKHFLFFLRTFIKKYIAMAIKVYRTPQDRAVIVENSPTQKKGYPNGLRLAFNNDNVTAFDNSNNQQVFSTKLVDITKQDNSPYATFEELQDVAGFRSGGGGGGSVNSVTASAPLASSGGVNPNISFATQPDGSYALSFSGGGTDVYLSDLAGLVGNIYTTDGSLTADRTVNLNDKQITFSSIDGNGLARFRVINNTPTYQTVLDLQPNVFGIQYVNAYTSSSNLLEIGNDNSLFGKTVNGKTTQINIGDTGIAVKDEIFEKGLEGENDFSANYTANSYVQKSYVDNKPAIIEYSNSITLGAVTIGNTADILVVNPISTLTELFITLPNPTADGKEVKVFFGGDITSGNVIDTLTVIGNTNGAKIVSGQLANPTQLITTNVVAGDSLTFTYSQSLNKWYIS
jgi:hypothetical protein